VYIQENEALGGREVVRLISINAANTL